MLVALLLSLQTVAAPSASGDVLDELIAKTSQLKSFTAVYVMADVITDEPASGTHEMRARIDYQAPDKMRLETHMSSMTMSQWLIDGTFTLRCDGDQPVHATFDMRAVIADLRPIQYTLDSAFPPAKARSDESRTVSQMTWSFDESTQKANFVLGVALYASAETPLGWLSTLRDKGEHASDSGETFRFDNDGHFKVTISKSTGFVEVLDGKSPHAELHVKLDSLERDGAIDPQRFALPSSPAQGEDLSDTFRKRVASQLSASLRELVYRRIAGVAGDAWSEGERAKITAVTRVYREYTLNADFEFLRQFAKKKGAEVATWLHQLEDAGHSNEEVSRARSEQIAEMEKALASQISKYSERMAVPVIATPLPRGDELLKLEREVATKAFDELVRAPIVHDFAQATSLEKK